MSDQATLGDAVVLERTFDAPIEMVWQMWTEPEHFKQWYGPQGFSIPVAQMDVREGGKRLICMASPDGKMKMWFTGEYVTVEPNGRLVYTDGLADEEGNVVSPAAMGMGDDFPTVTQVTVLLEERDGRTHMKMTHAGVPSDSGGAGGWAQAFEKMESYLAGQV